MFNYNFWHWLITGAQQIIDSLKDQLPLHATLNLIGLILSIVQFGLAPLLLWVGSFFDLRLLGIVIGVILVMEIARGALAVWMWIKNAIPVIG